MSDIAKLGIEIETKGADTAARQLNELERAAKRAADGAENFGEKVEQADRVLQDMTQTAQQADGAFDKPFLQVAAASASVRLAEIAIKGLTDTMTAGIRAFIDYERSVAQLTTSLDRVGNTTGFSIAQIREMASELEAATGMAEESILRAAQVLNRAGQATGDEFKRLMDLSLDLASAMGGDVVQAAETLAGVLTDPERSVNMLRRSFRDFDPVVASTVERLAQAGETSKAAGLALDELSRKLGGDAVAATNTLSGATARAADAWTDFARDAFAASGAADVTKRIMEGAANTAADLSAWVNNASGAAVNYQAKLAGVSAETAKYTSETAQAARQTSFLVSLWALMSGKGVAFSKINETNIRANKEAVDAMAPATATANRLAAANTLAAKAAAEKAERTARLAAAVKSNMQAEQQELSLIRMSTKERAVAEAGIAAYERTKQSLIRATGRFGAEEKAEAERAKTAAMEMARLNMQLREVEQAQGKAATATRRHAAAARELRNPIKELKQDLDGYVRSLEREAEIAGLTGTVRDMRIAEMRIEEMILQQLGKENIELASQYGARARAAIQASASATEALEAEQRALEDAARLQEEGIALFTDFATSVISGSENMGEALGRLLLRLVEVYLQMQLMQSMGVGGASIGGFFNFIGNMFGGGMSADSEMSVMLGNLSRGGVGVNGSILPMARGEMIGRPTMRPMAMMGEAGPEAVLPLRRDAAGNLGVASSGEGGVRVIVQNIDQRKNGSPVETEQTRGQNGEIVIRTYIRDEVRRALNDGSLDKDFSKNFNLGRNPTRRS